MARTPKPLPTQTELLERLDYNPLTGLLHWKTGWRAGCEALGTLTSSGYMVGVLPKDDRIYYAHRVIWKMVHGEDPSAMIDHDNGVRHDNRIENLLLATPEAQNRNRAMPRSNTSGIVGVSRQHGRWRATIGVHKRKLVLGLFDTIEEAAEARAAAEIEHGFSERHGKAKRQYENTNRNRGIQQRSNITA